MENQTENKLNVEVNTYVWCLIIVQCSLFQACFVIGTIMYICIELYSIEYGMLIKLIAKNMLWLVK